MRLDGDWRLERERATDSVCGGDRGSGLGFSAIGSLERPFHSRLLTLSGLLLPGNFACLSCLPAPGVVPFFSVSSIQKENQSTHTHTHTHTHTRRLTSTLSQTYTIPIHGSPTRSAPSAVPGPLRHYGGWMAPPDEAYHAPVQPHLVVVVFVRC